MIGDKERKAADEYAKKLPAYGTIGYDGFLAGIEWLLEQGVTYKDRIYPTTDNAGNVDGYCIDGEGELDACEQGVKDGKFQMGDDVVVLIYKK